MSSLTEFERAVLDKLLVGEHPVLDSLRAQLTGCTALKRELSGVGFLTNLFVSDEFSAAPITSRHIRLGDVIADVHGVENGVGFILLIDDGKLAMLEGYTFEEDWPSRPEIISLRYTSEPRNLSELD